MPLQPQAPSEANRTIWVGNIEPWMDEMYLSSSFSAIAPIKNVKLVVRDANRGNLPAGFAFVQFVDREPIVELLDRLNGDYFTGVDGQRFRINWASYGIGENRGQSDQDTSLYVGNLDTMIGDLQLYRIFAKRYNSVTSAKVIIDAAYQQSRGYGFVRFRYAEEAEAALVQMQGQLCGLKAMRIKKAMSKGPSQLPPPQQHPQQLGPYAPDLEHTATAACAAATASTPPDASAAAAASAPQPSPPPVPPPPAPVRPVGFAIVIPGVYAGWSEGDLAHTFGIFGTVFRVQVDEEKGITTVEFRDRVSAEIAVRHLSEQAGVQAAMAEAISDVQLAAPAITNMTTVQAAGHIQAHLQVQLQGVAQPSMEHFVLLLQDPFFATLFEEQVALRQAADACGEAVQLPWALEDRSALFADGRPSMQQMNADFVSSCGACGGPWTTALGGRCAPMLPEGL
eukprot:CAMPEP_0115395498 /NCGR_PEP_ID=MMETSP0271-20121206/12818_1 /TAXON_ID=71861 /ORGANISM="Scrippsiella trochoidea, Strain CCMP3099" /LENGTH=452 /DNA_ID=CAMNT_0002819213 /DNA_START=100 /DNA_END=1456 /DNA_ORIENTATION=+